MKLSRLLLVTHALLALVLATAAFTSGSCSSGQKRTAQQNVVTGLRITAKAVEPGIETMRSFREAGEVDPATSLALARGALDANSAAKNLAQAALDGADAHTLGEQLQTLVDLAGKLERDGTLHLKNGRTRLVFELGVIAAKNGLVIALDEFKGSGGTPAAFTLDEETRKSLTELMPVFEKNDRLLREAVARLTGSQ